jgi:hypothetical protein
VTHRDELELNLLETVGDSVIVEFVGYVADVIWRCLATSLGVDPDAFTNEERLMQ